MRSVGGTGREVVMAAQDEDIFRRHARVLKTLADASRLKIVDRLSRGQCSVGELTDIVGSDRTTVSKHLAVLRGPLATGTARTVLAVRRRCQRLRLRRPFLSPGSRRSSSSRSRTAVSARRSARKIPGGASTTRSALPGVASAPSSHRHFEPTARLRAKSIVVSYPGET